MLPIALALLLAGLILPKGRLRTTATAVAAGVPAGLALGAGLRLAMFIAALMGGERQRTLGGTIGLIVFAAVPASIVSAVVIMVRKLITVRAVYLGLVTLLLGGLPLLGSDSELRTEGVFVVNLVTFGAVLWAFGFMLLRLQQRIEGWWDRKAAARAGLDGTAMIDEPSV